MTFLSDLLKINEGFSPDFDSMSDDELKQLCVELDATDLCQLDDEGNILNREELIRDLEAGHGDVDPSPMESVKHDLAKKERKATSPYVNVVHDVSNLYSKPVHAVKETAPTVKFHQMADGNKPVALPAYGGKQGDVKNKSAKQAVEDKIGSAGTKGMKKKDRPYMVKPRFRDWLTANMYFNMTKSGELAGKMKLGEGSKTVYPNAKVIKNKKGKKIGEIYPMEEDPNAWGYFHYGMDFGADSIDDFAEAFNGLRDAHQEYISNLKGRKSDVDKDLNTLGEAHYRDNTLDNAEREDDWDEHWKEVRRSNDLNQLRRLIRIRNGNLKRYGPDAKSTKHVNKLIQDIYDYWAEEGETWSEDSQPRGMEDQEETSLPVYYAHVPANIYDGKYYDHRTVRVSVVAENPEQVVQIINSNKEAVLAHLDKKRMRSGQRTVRYVGRPIEKNVFFKGNYSIRPLLKGYSANALTRDGNFERVVAGEPVGEST